MSLLFLQPQRKRDHQSWSKDQHPTMGDITMQGWKESIVCEKERPSKLVYGSVKGLVKAVFVYNGTLKIDPIMKV